MFDVTKVNNDLSLLSPFFRRRIELALREVHLAGHEMFIFEGWRSPARQNYLYEQGRTREGKIITNSKDWSSMHQFGLAVDLVFKTNNRWTWEGDFEKPSIIIKRHGFKWGGDFKSFVDRPHYQMDGGLSLPECRAITNQMGLQALWLKVEEQCQLQEKKQALS